MERAGWNIVRKGWRWIVLIPLLFGASLSFLQCAGWVAVFSGNYGGLPSRQWLVNDAKTKAQIYFWICGTMVLCSVGMVITFLPTFETEYYSGAIALMLRFALASVLVLALGFAICLAHLAIGHHLG